MESKLPKVFILSVFAIRIFQKLTEPLKKVSQAQSSSADVNDPFHTNRFMKTLPCKSARVILTNTPPLELDDTVAVFDFAGIMPRTIAYGVTPY